MFVLMVKTNHITKEVHSIEHDEKLKLLKLFKSLGFITSIHKEYTYSGWRLSGFLKQKRVSEYTYSGKWDKESE